MGKNTNITGRPNAALNHNDTEAKERDLETVEKDKVGSQSYLI